MKTDALYLSLFETTPSLALRLAGYDIAEAAAYTCSSEELKKTFRVDVVFTPPRVDLPLILAEVQFQKEVGIYDRLVASAAIERLQFPLYADVRMVLFFANRLLDTGAGIWQPLVDAGTLHVVYLDEATLLPLERALSLEEQACLLLMRVTVSPADRAADNRVAAEFGRVVAPLRSEALGSEQMVRVLKDFFINLYLSKYKSITIEEIASMIDSIAIFDDIGESRAVQEYAEERVQKATRTATHVATLSNAVSFIRAGVGIEQVASILGLSVSEIESAAGSLE